MSTVNFKMFPISFCIIIFIKIFVFLQQSILNYGQIMKLVFGWNGALRNIVLNLFHQIK